jgi:hypothetical protein
VDPPISDVSKVFLSLFYLSQLPTFSLFFKYSFLFYLSDSECLQDSLRLVVNHRWYANGQVLSYDSTVFNYMYSSYGMNFAYHIKIFFFNPQFPSQDLDLRSHFLRTLINLVACTPIWSRLDISISIRSLYKINMTSTRPQLFTCPLLTDDLPGTPGFGWLITCSGHNPHRLLSTAQTVVATNIFHPRIVYDGHALVVYSSYNISKMSSLPISSTLASYMMAVPLLTPYKSSPLSILKLSRCVYLLLSPHSPNSPSLSLLYSQLFSSLHVAQNPHISPPLSLLYSRLLFKFSSLHVAQNPHRRPGVRSYSVHCQFRGHGFYGLFR